MSSVLYHGPLWDFSEFVFSITVSFVRCDNITVVVLFKVSSEVYMRQNDKTSIILNSLGEKRGVGVGKE